VELRPLVDPALEPFAEEARLVTAQAAAATAGPAPDLSTAEGVRRARTPNAAFLGTPVAVDAERFDVPTASGSVETRVIRPAGRPQAVYLYLHGGGFFTGRAAMADATGAALASQLGVCTVSVEYRLAPEHPYPAAEDDCTSVAEWLLGSSREAFGSDILLIGGSSAGATLAVRTLLRLGPGGLRFRGVNLIYGVFDLSSTPSAQREDLRFFDAYLPDAPPERRRVPEISPLYAELSGLPPALFTVGDADFVFDDSLFMAMRWLAAGNRTELSVYPAAGHGFDLFPTNMARAANERISAWMQSRIDSAGAPTVTKGGPP